MRAGFDGPMPPDPSGASTRTSTTSSRGALRAVALPTEHGGWSLTLEPVLLGLLVAWSWPGLAIGAAAMLAFVARTPVKVVLVDRWRGRWLPRSRLATMVGLIEITLLVLLVTLAWRSASHSFWVPAAVAAPLIALELWYDMRSRSRRLVPELAGAVGIGSVAAVIARAAGEDLSAAVGLWVVLAARSVAAIPFVRVQVARLRHPSAATWPSDVSQIGALLVAALAWLLDVLPGASAVVLAVIGVVHVSASRRPVPKIAVVGIQQMVLGLVLIVVTALTYTG